MNRPHSQVEAAVVEAEEGQMVEAQVKGGGILPVLPRLQRPMKRLFSIRSGTVFWEPPSEPPSEPPPSLDDLWNLSPRARAPLPP